MLTVTPNVLPTGGAVQLDISSDAATITINRATSVSGVLSAWTQLYTGVLTPYYIDVGDGLPGPLLQDTLYVYQVTDSGGDTYQSTALSVSGTVSIDEDFMTPLLIKLLHGGLQALTLPSQFGRVNVLHAMPLTGQPRMPLVTLNLDLMQQDKVPMGQQVQMTPMGTPTGVWVIEEFAKWRYVISVLSFSAQERDFYRQAILGILKVLLARPLNSLGRNIEHSWQVSSGQVSSEKDSPGFYLAEIAFEITGTFNISVSTNSGVVESINTSTGITMVNSTSPPVTDTITGV